MLIKCKECSAGMSSQAKVCPACGAPAPTTKMDQIVYLVLTVLLVVGGIYVMSGE